MKNEREFEFRYSIDEIESVTVTSLGNWLASAQKFTRPPSAQLGRPDDPKALLLQHLTAKLVEPLSVSQNILRAYQVGNSPGPVFEKEIQDLIDNRRLIVSGSRLGQVLANLRSQDLLVATVAQSCIAGSDLSDLFGSPQFAELVQDSTITSGIVLGEYLKRGLLGPPTPLPPVEVGLSEKARSEVGGLIDSRIASQLEVATRVTDQALTKLDLAEKSQGEQLQVLNDLKTKLEDLLVKTPVELKQIEEAFRFEGSTRAAFEHWDTKAQQHRGRAARYLAVFMGIVGAFILGLGYLALQTSLFSVTWLQVPVSLTVLLFFGSAIAFWLGRLIVKQYLSERHLCEDAAERSALIRTFTSMIKSGEIKADSVDSVLAALFRSAATGLLTGDGSPTLPADLAGKIVERLRSN